MTKHSDNSNLIELSRTPYPRRWFLVLIVSFILISLAYLVVYWKLGVIAKSSHITTNDAWRMLATEYVLGQPSEVVIVGSSLSHVMKEGYFSSFNPKSLTFSGGSSLTGLEVINCHRPLPHIVLVETNILSREIEHEFIKSYCQNGEVLARGKVLLQQYHPLRMAVAATLGSNYSPDDARSNGLAEAVQLRSAAPKHYDIDEKIHKAIEVYKTIEFESVTHRNARRMRELVSQFEKEGTRVYFFQMPLPDDIRSSRYFSGTESILRKELGRTGRWLNTNLRKEELRWVDPGHLDARSAVLMVDAIETTLSMEKE